LSVARRAAVAGVAVSLLCVGCGGSESRDSTISDAEALGQERDAKRGLRIERLLNEGGGTDFSTLAETSDWTCTPPDRSSGSPPVATRFSCRGTDSEGEETTGTWGLVDDELARWSDGGDTGSAPASAEEASKIVSGVVTSPSRAGDDGGSAECVPQGELETPGGTIETPGTYRCTLLGSDGTPLLPDGEPAVVLWEWDERTGAVLSERLD